jgi:hypothetical protein
MQNDISGKKIINYRLNEVFYMTIEFFKTLFLLIFIIIVISLYPELIKFFLIKFLLTIFIIYNIRNLFILRKRKRNIYGFIEIIFGLITLSLIIFNPIEIATTGVNDILKLLGGIYITIRKLNNIEKGIKSPFYKKIWEKIFKEII